MNRQLHSNPSIKFNPCILPHNVLTSLSRSLYNKLKSKLAQHPEAVGIGEVGLDFTTSCHCTVFHNMKTCKARTIDEQRKSSSYMSGIMVMERRSKRYCLSSRNTASRTLVYTATVTLEGKRSIESREELF